MAYIEYFYGSVLIISGSGRYLRYKTVEENETRAKETGVMFTFSNAALEKNATMTVVLKILTCQITAT